MKSTAGVGVGGGLVLLLETIKLALARALSCLFPPFVPGPTQAAELLLALGFFELFFQPPVLFQNLLEGVGVGGGLVLLLETIKLVLARPLSCLFPPLFSGAHASCGATFGPWLLLSSSFKPPVLFQRRPRQNGTTKARQLIEPPEFSC